LQSIASVYGLSRETIRQVAIRNGVTERHGFDLIKKRYQQERATFPTAEIVAEYLSGATLEKVGEKFLVSIDKVKRILADTGIKIRRYSAREFNETTKAVIALSHQGIRPTEICERLGISKSLCSVIRNRRKLVNRENDLRHTPTREKCYPYLDSERDDPTGLLAMVNRMVPAQVPHFIRADVCQDIILAILEGSLRPGEMKTAVPKALARVRRMHPFLFAPISLDQEIPGTDGLRMIDTIDSDRMHF